MARYVMVEVDDNDRADKLMDKLRAVPGLKVIGLWGKPTSFCQCELLPRTIRGKKFGWFICPECGCVRDNDAPQHPNNLLHLGVPGTMQNIYITIREPYQTPQEMHGQPAIDKRVDAERRTRQVIRQYRERRANRKPRRSRARRSLGVE